MACGGAHSLALKTDGSIVAWGRNSEHQCDVPSPNGNFVTMAGSYYHSLGVKTDGSAVTWGAYGTSTLICSEGYKGVAAGPALFFVLTGRHTAAVPPGEVDPQGSLVWLRVNPNPGRGIGTVSFGLPSREDVTLRVFDVLGRELARREMAGVEPGTHLVDLNLPVVSGRPLAPGVYVIRLEAGSRLCSQRWVMLR
jgi:hypothetical protein